MSIVNVTLEEILCARDARAAAQRRLLRTYRLPLVSFTMNIAGPVKFSPLIELAFDAGLEALRTALGQPVAAEIIRPATGCEALLVYDRPAAALKAACLTLETATPVEEDLLAEVQRLRAENAYLKKLNALVAERVRQERKRK